VNGDSLRQLQRLLIPVESAIRGAVERARQTGGQPTDALRGLVITEQEIDELLGATPLEGWGASERGRSPRKVTRHNRFERLIQTFELNDDDRAILLIALAAELDRRYERLFAYLQDDVTQRRATVNLVMNLLGQDAEQRFAIWERLLPNAPLRAHHLVECVADAHMRDPIFLAHAVKVDLRIVAHLLGDGTPDPRLHHAVERLHAATSERAGQVESNEAPLVYLQGHDAVEQRETAARFSLENGVPLVRIDLHTLKTLPLPFDLVWRLALREGYLGEAAVLVEGWEAILDDERRIPADVWQTICTYPRMVFLAGTEGWEPEDADRSRRLLRIKLDTPPYNEQLRLWVDALQAQGVAVDPGDIAELAGKFRLGAGSIRRAVQAALDHAATRGEPARLGDLYAGAQSQTGLHLGKLAQRIDSRYVWDDLILPDDRLEQLRELCARARYGHVVREQWGYGRKIAPTRGISALFAGDSGTGKTMAAEVIASDLGLLLYKIDLSAVVSKYIGETEKNLRGLFDAAERTSAVLFFDEADALFGKRSEVKDSHDRYANIEIAYLLQQIERYDGIAILATNLRQNLDEAFTRRLDFLIDFPFPEPEYRRKLWAAHFPADAPVGRDVNLDDLAERYRLAGGNIRNAALAAAFLAAADGGVITMGHVRHAVRREHQKIGRLLDDHWS
jgi:hypothetical protein